MRASCSIGPFVVRTCRAEGTEGCRGPNVGAACGVTSGRRGPGLPAVGHQGGPHGLHRGLMLVEHDRLRHQMSLPAAGRNESRTTSQISRSPTSMGRWNCRR